MKKPVKHWGVTVTASDGTTKSHYPFPYPADKNPNQDEAWIWKSQHWAKSTSKIDEKEKWENPTIVYHELDETALEIKRQGMLKFIRASKLAKGIIHYKDGSFWVWFRKQAYNGDRLKPEIWDALWCFERRFMRGHDTRAWMFNLRRCRAKTVELDCK